MSAWDITGAVVWTMFSVAVWTTCVERRHLRDEGWRTTQSLGGILGIGAAIFCIARLCGAHA